jgi:DNA-directed RNA polymerase beta subunit
LIVYLFQERDTLISHGASAVAQDRLLEASDKYKTAVCGQCGMFAVPAPPKQKHTAKLLGVESKPYCRKCKSSDYVKQTIMPYAFSILVRDLEAFHISMRMELTNQN